LFPVRMNHVNALSALDRRRLEAEFLHWAEQFNSVDNYCISRKTVTRNKMTIDAVEDMWWNRTEHESPATSPLPLMSSPIIGDARTTVNVGESSVFRLDWNANFKAVSGATNNYHLRVVPFAAGSLLWEGSDILQPEWPLELSGSDWIRNTGGGRPLDDDGPHSLNGRAYFSAPTGRFQVGLIAMVETDLSIWTEADYEARSVQLVVRRPF